MAVEWYLTSMTKLMDERDAGIKRLGAAFRPAGPEAASDDTPIYIYVYKARMKEEGSTASHHQLHKRPKSKT